MSLEVRVVKATNVPNPETFGKCDPYASVEFQGIKKKTEVVKGDLNPKWDQTLKFPLSGQGITSSDQLNITVFDWERVGRNRQLGTAKVPLGEFVNGGSKEKTINLMDANGRDIQASTINLVISCDPPPKPKGGGAAGAGGSGGDGGAQVVEVTVEEEVAEGDATEGGAAGVPGAPGAKVKPKKVRSKVRPSLSSKPQDQQIRVKVVQARQLSGANLQPVVRVSVMNQMKQTRIKKSTTSPWWDEQFFFNFHVPPTELVDEIVDFSVYNARTLRADALIGSFKCDVGLIYDEAQHALVNKWVLLSDPEDASLGARGYLKISACVLGPGDVSPNMAAEQNDEDEDIESNLLRPAGVQLRPATFTLRLYQAEDIPRMDSAFLEGVKKVFRIGEEQKELVDPYVIFGFAGKEVKSKIMYANDHPDFFQDLRVGLQFPSMCERIKLQIRDWDRLNKDDNICTGFIPVSTISSYQEEGFLPTFGPCYINLYGSTREYSDLPGEYEDLNLGKGEGVAYRGRALIELTTTLGELPEIPVEDMPGDDKLRVQKFMRRRKYRVHAAFLNASMISPSHADAPIEFEVSIGNYGNKLDENVPPCPSTTQPTNAVFDGCYYYFLPWASTKPCVVVDSSWEDISWRLESLNIMLNIIDTMNANLERIQIGVKAKLPVPEQAQLLISLLDRLISDCDTPLAAPKDGKHVANELDRLMATHRSSSLAGIKEMATNLRENATDLEEALAEVENLMAMVQNLAHEPQNSMPDVVIWMLSGQKRIAYYRIPAYELLYSDDAAKRGKHCGQLMTLALKYPCVKDKDRKFELPVLLRVKLWLGLQTQDQAWHKMQTEGELAVYAETYENQVNILGTWTNKGPTMSRPKWSDSEGRLELNKDEFKPPPGWNWEKDWYISPEMSMLYDKDAGHKNYLEDAYECQSRNLPGSTWGPASRPWTDVKGDPCQDKSAFPLPSGWKWDDDWQIDLNRAVDEEGYEYCVEATVGGYGATEKTYHLCRRRRWVRPRSFVKSAATAKKQHEIQKKKQTEGWEYAPLFNMKFHAQERTMDLVRRRRWHRKMVSGGEGGAVFFNLQSEQKEADKDLAELASLAAPRMFLTFDAAHKYQLRAYIYQARDVIAADDSGLSDPFARVSFITHSMITETMKKTLSPTWDQTLIFGEIEIYGDPKALEASAPEAYIELFDHDTFGKPEFMGRTKAQVMVKLDPADARTAVLQWYPISRLSQDGGELLAAFELIKIPEGGVIDGSDELAGKDMPFLPPKRGDLYIVPNGIRPVMQRTGIEVLCWGVRNMKRYQLAAVTSPSVRLECGGNVLDSLVIKDTRRNPNFPQNLLFFDVMLPKEELYMPPMNIRVKDHRQFGRKPTVGVHILKSLERFRIKPPSDMGAALVELPAAQVSIYGGTTEGDTSAPKQPATSGQQDEKGGVPPPGDPTLVSLTAADIVVNIPEEGENKDKTKLSKWGVKRPKFLPRWSKVKKDLPRLSLIKRRFKNIRSLRLPGFKDDAPKNVGGKEGNVAKGEEDSSSSEEDNVPTGNKPSKAVNANKNNSAIISKLQFYVYVWYPVKRYIWSPFLYYIWGPIMRFIVSPLNEYIWTPIYDCLKPYLKRFQKVDVEEVKRIKRRKYEKWYKHAQESELTAQEIDWWSKLFASTNDLEKCKKYRKLGYDKLEILPASLEKVPEYQDFTDFCHTLHLTRGKNDDDEDENVIGEFKGSFRVYPLPPDPNEPIPPKVFQMLPPSDPEECIVRLYVIRAVDLQPNDPNGLADPYLEVKLGKTKLNTRDEYIANSISPVFGRLFEIKTLLPLSKDLTIRVKDYDLLSSDDIIGETTIDLENRYLSHFRATVGLPKTYWTSGINQWRDSQKPVDILKWYCLKNRLGEVIFNGPTVSVGNKLYKLSEFEPRPPLNKHLGSADQRLALHVLNLLPLVKEHVESRPLYNPLQPNIEQGRLHMWVDIFPTSLGPPGPPFDISPRKPKKYVLRVVIWNTKDVILEETSITGEKMSDIFLKGWMGGIDEKQKTDIHYRSLDGEGNFNWRMTFPFDYQVAEQTMVVKKKEHFWSLDETTLTTTPKFITQVWDNDKFSADDFIGHLELNLNAMPMPAKRARSCKISMLPDVGKDVKLVSLFEMRHMKGFWPCYDDSTGTRVLTGKIEMEMELVTEAEALERPAGLGREEPNLNPKLDPPNRPETSFLWFTSPWKTFKYIIWRNYGCMIICGILLFLLLLLVAMFIYSFPSLMAELVVDSLKPPK